MQLGTPFVNHWAHRITPHMRLLAYSAVKSGRRTSRPVRALAKTHDLWFILLGIAAGSTIYYGTAVAPWAYSDGVGYLVTARNLVEGPGLGLVKPSGQFEPLVTHPPLYPLLLASGGAVGLEILTAARWIGVLSFGITIAVAGSLTRRITNRLRAGISVALLLLVSPPFVLLFLAAMAESVFFLTGILSLITLALGLKSGRRLHLFLSAGLAGLSTLSRYPGLVFVLTGALILLLYPAGRRDKLKSAGLYTLIGISPAAVFLVVSRWFRTAGAPRWLAPPGLEFEQFLSFSRQALQVLWSWKPLPTAAVLEALSPGAGESWRWVGASLALVMAAALLGYLWTHRARLHWPSFGRVEDPLLTICGVFVMLYLGFLLAAFLFTSPTPDVDFRTVLPVLPVLLIGGVVWLSALAGDAPEEPATSKVLYTLFFLAVIAGYLPATAELLIGHHRTGAGYTAKAWQNSELVGAVQELPADRPLISNAPEGFLMHASRYPYDFADLALDHQPGCVGQGDSPLDKLFRDEGAALVLVSTELGGREIFTSNGRADDFRPLPCAARTLYSGSEGRLLVHPDVVR